MAHKRRISVPGKNLVDKIQQLILRRDVRRICLLQEERSLLEIPVQAGDPASPAAALTIPVLAALRAFSTLVNDCTVEVESDEEISEKEL